jgi:serine/threonine-protein phosphatase PP1 catalytic subunit
LDVEEMKIINKIIKKLEAVKKM